MKTLGVGAVFSAAHRQGDGPLHGHSYEVVCWFECPVDGDDAKINVEALAKELDHSDITPMGFAEDIAQWFGRNVTASDACGGYRQCFKVQVNRPLERVFGEWFNEAY